MFTLNAPRKLPGSAGALIIPKNRATFNCLKFPAQRRFYFGGVMAAEMTAIPSGADIPGLTTVAARIFSECGLVTAGLLVVVIWLVVQLAKARAGWESDRAGMMKLYAEQNATNDKLAVSSAKLEGLLYALQRRDASDNDG